MNLGGGYEIAVTSKTGVANLLYAIHQMFNIGFHMWNKSLVNNLSPTLNVLLLT